MPMLEAVVIEDEHTWFKRISSIFRSVCQGRRIDLLIHDTHRLREEEAKAQGLKEIRRIQVGDLDLNDQYLHNGDGRPTLLLWRVGTSRDAQVALEVLEARRAKMLAVFDILIEGEDMTTSDLLDGVLHHRFAYGTRMPIIVYSILDLEEVISHQGLPEPDLFHFISKTRPRSDGRIPGEALRDAILACIDFHLDEGDAE